MSASPVTVALFEPDTPAFRRLRRIENEYLLRSIAQSEKELIQFQKLSLCAQVGLAERIGNLDSLVSVLGASVVEGLSGISSQLSNLSGDVEEILALQYDQLETLVELRQFLENAFLRTAEILLESQKTLEQIADQLRRPYEMQALELRSQADRWLKHGMKSQGRSRKESYCDALSLLIEATKNPIGNQDHEVWFQIGWLRWKHEEDLASARDAFHRAARLAEVPNDTFLALSLRHEAYMSYFLDDFPAAYQLASRAVEVERDGQTLFELARYAAKSGRADEATAVLAEAVRFAPPLIVTMFSEVDLA